MNPQNNTGDNRETRTCCSRTRECMVFTCVVAFSAFVFFASMALTVYFTHIANLDMAVSVLILGSFLLFLSGFCGNMYGIYISTPNVGPPESRENSNQSIQTVGSSSHSPSTNVRDLDLINFPRAREVFRVTPPPPYEIQMLEMSRRLLPQTPRPTESSARETDRVQEALKLIQRLYEEMKRTGKLEPEISTEEQPVQQVLQTFNNPVRQQQSMSPKVSHQNLVVQKQQAVAKSSPGRRMPLSSVNDQPGQKVVQTPKASKRQRQSMSPQVSHQNLVVQKQQSVSKSSPGRGLPLSSMNDQPEQKEVQTPNASKRLQQSMLPQVSHQNLVVQKQQSVAKGSPGRKILPVGCLTNQQKGPKSSISTDLERLLIGTGGYNAVNPPVGCHTNQEEVPQSSLPTELDLGRLLIGSEGCSAANPQSSSRISGHPPVGFGTNQDIKQKLTPDLPPIQPYLEKFVIGNDGYVVSSPQMSPRRVNVLRASKRKSTSPKYQHKVRPNAEGNIIRMASIVNLSQNNEYEEIEDVENIQGENSSQRAYDLVESCYTENRFEHASEQSSSGASGTSKHSLEQRKMRFLTSNVEEPHQLLTQASRKFCKLGVLPQTVMNAIPACPELGGDEWMAAWNLYLQKFTPLEREKFLVYVCKMKESQNIDV